MFEGVQLFLIEGRPNRRGGEHVLACTGKDGELFVCSWRLNLMMLSERARNLWYYHEWKARDKRREGGGRGLPGRVARICWLSVGPHGHTMHLLVTGRFKGLNCRRITLRVSEWPRDPTKQPFVVATSHPV